VRDGGGKGITYKLWLFTCRNLKGLLSVFVGERLDAEDVVGGRSEMTVSSSSTGVNLDICLSLKCVDSSCLRERSLMLFHIQSTAAYT
jgi:hypothetical protein